MPLQLLDIGWPDLGLGGIATGRLDYRWRGANGAPSGRADLHVRGLSRAGLVLSSKPIDVGLAAVLSTAARRRCARWRSATARPSAAPRRGSRRWAAGRSSAELINAPMFVQLRYAGPADTLWRLSGVEVFDLSGPVAIGADISGRLVDPDHPRLAPQRRTRGSRAR